MRCTWHRPHRVYQSHESVLLLQKQLKSRDCIEKIIMQLSQLQMQGMWTVFHLFTSANIRHLNTMHHTWRVWAIYFELHSITSLFKLILALGNRLACICFYFYQFFTCGFIEVAVLHAWYEIEELGEIALSHANGSHNLDSATVGMGRVVIQHRHWTNPSNHGRSHTTKTTWAKLICT